MTASYFSQTGLVPSDTKSDEYVQPPPQIRENLQSLQSGILKIFFVLQIFLSELKNKNSG